MSVVVPSPLQKVGFEPTKLCTHQFDLASKIRGLIWNTNLFPSAVDHAHGYGFS